jgi:hypothetical protein
MPPVLRLGVQNEMSSEPTSDTSATTTEPSSSVLLAQGYILAVDIEQQITGALYGYSDLATIGALFNLTSVEPYVLGTNLVGVPEIETTVPEVMDLSKLYDMESMRSKFESCSVRNDHKLSTFAEFLRKASRNVVFVSMIADSDAYNLSFSADAQNQNNGIALKNVARLNKWAAYVLKQEKWKLTPFRISHVLLVDARPTVPLPLSVITKELGSIVAQQFLEFGSVTLIFDDWRGIHNKPTDDYFYFVPGFVFRSCHSVMGISHSTAVINASRTFAQSLNDTPTLPIIGVHIRGERILRDYKGNFTDCFQQLSERLRELSALSSQVRVVHDLGPGGTKSCNMGPCHEGRPQFLEEVHKLGYPVVHFDPAKYPSTPQSLPFVAFVEQEYLSSVDVLVTVGWGGFQHTAVRKFLERDSHNSDHLFRICSSALPS